jgi:hypothetical protein
MSKRVTSAEAEFRGYETAGRYALALTQRLAIREAKRRKAPAVLLLEDDVVFHPNFQTLAASVDLPEDWGIFYLGCSHSVRPAWVGSRVVRAKYAVDTHAVAIREPYYDIVMEMLDRHGKPDAGVAKASDQFLALLHAEIPAYACYPNLAWQDASDSDLMGFTYSNYHRDGLQRGREAGVKGLLEELVQGKGDGFGRAKLGLLFLTRGDVEHPEVWRQFVAEAPESVRIYSHPKFPEQLEGGFLEGTAIAAKFDTQWGDISLVRASRALLLEALQDESLTHFVLLSESCVPVRPLPEILRQLELDPRPRFGFATLDEALPGYVGRIGDAPQIPSGCWRFASQWWLLDRIAAIFSVGEDLTHLFEKMFAPDEGYFATVLAMQGYPLEGLVMKTDVTWKSWEVGGVSPTGWIDLPQDRLESLLHSNAFFARKFPKGATIAKLGLHRSAGPGAAVGDDGMEQRRVQRA